MTSRTQKEKRKPRVPSFKASFVPKRNSNNHNKVTNNTNIKKSKIISKSESKQKLPILNTSNNSMSLNSGRKREINIKANTSDLMMQKYNQSILKSTNKSSPVKKYQSETRVKNDIKLPNIHRPVNLNAPLTVLSNKKR